MDTKKDPFQNLQERMRNALADHSIRAFQELSSSTRDLMSCYRCAIMEIETKFRVLNERFSLQHDRNPIDSIQSRLKSPDSILDKMLRKNLPFTLEAIENNIFDIAGIRVVCSFVDDIYMLADCLLQQGASKVFAIDVGYGQLAWKIRSDPRVVVMERTNIRYVTPEDLGEPLDLSVVDVSFISLKIVLPAIQKLLKPTGQVLCLIKPQFEAGKENVGKKGVVRDPAVHADVLQNFLALADSLHFTVRNLTFSPVKGPEGNIEFLAHLSMQPGQAQIPDVAALVAQAHETLKG
mgnify:FL=1